MIYRKWGTVVRWEHGTIVRVTESGEAREIGSEFIAEPVILSREDSEGSPLATSEILRFAQDDVARLPITIERLVLTEGHALHECGAHRWEETQRRLHLSIINQQHRVLIDRADFDIAPIAEIAGAFARMRGERQVSSVRLAPNVAAAILPSLIGAIDLEQMPGDHDGYGEPIARMRVSDATPPNAYRPSYRIRPLRAWHNLRAIPFGTFSDAPRAIALLAPPHDGTLRVLCVDGGEAFASEVEVRRITAAGEAECWYPFAAGAFGAELML